MRKSSVKKDELGMWGLETRAWIVAIGIYIGRITGMLTLSIPWFQEEKLCDDTGFEKCYKPYNEAVLDSTSQIARIIVQVLTIVGAILCLLCLKWRHLAGWFIYIEMFI